MATGARSNLCWTNHAVRMILLVSLLSMNKYLILAAYKNLFYVGYIEDRIPASILIFESM